MKVDMYVNITAIIPIMIVDMDAFIVLPVAYNKLIYLKLIINVI